MRHPGWSPMNALLTDSASPLARDRSYVPTSIPSPSMRDLPRSVPSRTDPACQATASDAGSFTRGPDGIHGRSSSLFCARGNDIEASSRRCLSEPMVVGEDGVDVEPYRRLQVECVESTHI